MAVSHVFTNLIADGTNTNIVRPSDWNSGHVQAVTLSGNTAGVSSITGTNIVFGGSNNVTVSGIQGANAGTVNFIAPSAGAGAIAVSAGTTSGNLQTLQFNDSNGVSFGLNGSTLTATVKTDYLTTARASTDAVGLATAQSNVTWTVNSNGISLDARGYAGTGTTFAGANVSGSMTVNSNGVNLSLSAGAGGGGADGVNILAAGTQTANTTGTVLFNDGNGVTFGMSNNSVITATVKTDYLTSQSNQNITAANGGFAFQTLSFSNLNGISFGTSAGSAITASHNAITTGRASNDGVGLNTAQTNVTWTVNSSGISLNAGGYAGTGYTSTTTAGTAIVATHATNGLSLAFPTIITNAITTARASTDAIGLNTAQSNVTWTVNSSGLSLDARGYAGTGTTFNGANVSGSMTVNSNGVNLSLSAGAGGGGLTQGTFYANSNTTQSSSGTIAFSSLNFAGAGIASVGVSNGSVLISVPAGGGAGDGGVSAGVSNLGNTAGSTGIQTAGNFVLVGSNGISLSQSTAAGNATVTFLGLGNKETISSWQYPSEINSSSAMAGQSVSMAVAFQMPQDGSFSFMRLPASMQTNSTTIATVATANANMSAELYSTWNAVVYSLGTGANSKSLQSVVSGSGGFTWRNSISITNSTQYSVTQAFSAQAEGAGTTLTTQYSISNTNWSLVSTLVQPSFSAARYIDIPFANSLTPGPYWVVFGFSTSSNTNNASFAAGTNCNVRFTAVHGATQTNQVWGVFGSTNLTSGGLAGVGSFSTAGGGTTASIPISAISSNASHFIPNFQFLRSA